MNEEKSKPQQSPSVGRVVHYTPHRTGPDEQMRWTEGKPLTAFVCFVHDDDRYLNLAVFDEDGAHFSRKAVPLTGAQAGSEGARAAWAWPAHVPPRQA